MGLLRLRASLGLVPKDYPGLLGRSHAIYNGLTEHPAVFTVPYAGLATLQDKIQKFDDAQQKVGARTKGAAAARNLCARELITSLEGARYYVQQHCDANPEQALVFIEAASMKVMKASTYRKPLLTAAQLTPSATVHLVANVSVLTAGIKGRIYFGWQISSDGGKSWTNARPTPHGHTDITGLAPMQVYGFRVCVNHAKGDGAWTDMVTLLVT